VREIPPVVRECFWLFAVTRSFSVEYFAIALSQIVRFIEIVKSAQTCERNAKCSQNRCMDESNSDRVPKATCTQYANVEI